MFIQNILSFWRLSDYDESCFKLLNHFFGYDGFTWITDLFIFHPFIFSLSCLRYASVIISVNGCVWIITVYHGFKHTLNRYSKLNVASAEGKQTQFIKKNKQRMQAPKTAN